MGGIWPGPLAEFCTAETQSSRAATNQQGSNRGLPSAAEPQPNPTPENLIRNARWLCQGAVGGPNRCVRALTTEGTEGTEEIIAVSQLPCCVECGTWSTAVTKQRNSSPSVPSVASVVNQARGFQPQRTQRATTTKSKLLKSCLKCEI